jgi:hypothetical protein
VRLTYANVMSTLFVLLALGAGTALAASQVLPKNSVGTKQLRSGAVTAAKLKRNAVTKVKIKNGAVDGSRIKDGSVTGSEIDPATTPFSRIVFSTRGSSSVSLKSGPTPVPYPLTNSTYTQEPGRDDIYLGALDLTFDPACKPPRQAVALVNLDQSMAANPMLLTLLADSAGAVIDNTGGRASWRINIGPYQGAGSFRPETPTSRTISLYVYIQCSSGSGATATSGGVDVIGVK